MGKEPCQWEVMDQPWRCQRTHREVSDAPIQFQFLRVGVTQDVYV